MNRDPFLDKWHRMLRNMINDYRRNNPNDKRSDIQLTESLLDHFWVKGLVEKNIDGKWILPKIKNKI